jgi:hypothetical protein
MLLSSLEVEPHSRKPLLKTRFPRFPSALILSSTKCNPHQLEMVHRIIKVLLEP